jgi:hypothetical protein
MKAIAFNVCSARIPSMHPIPAIAIRMPGGVAVKR